MKSKRNKHLFFLIALLVCACSKEAVSTESLKGTWKVYEQSAYFCGKEVSKGIDYFEADDVQMTFSEGRVSFLEDGEAFSYPCTSSGKTINMQAIFSQSPCGYGNVQKRRWSWIFPFLDWMHMREPGVLMSLWASKYMEMTGFWATAGITENRDRYSVRR